MREYQYLAICLEKDKYGEIVYGVEPEYEETSKVCDNFDQLIKMFNNQGNFYLKQFK